MSMMIIYRRDADNFVIIPYRRPKWDSLEYASRPLVVVSNAEVEAEVFGRLGSDLAETKNGCEPDKIQKLTWSKIAANKENERIETSEHAESLSSWSKQQEDLLLADATALQIGPKKIIGGFADVIRFTPCIVMQKRLHKIIDKDPSLNIEVAFPMPFKDFSKAFRLALNHAGSDDPK